MLLSDDSEEDEVLRMLCCGFKKHIFDIQCNRSAFTKELAEMHHACETCRRRVNKKKELRQCANPYGVHRHPNFKKLIVRVDELLKRKYPIFRNCEFICGYCVHRADKEKRRRKIDEIIIKTVKKKVSISENKIYFFSNSLFLNSI